MPKNWIATSSLLLSGLTLSTLFFFPLLTALSGSNIDLLHWALIDSTETILSWLFVGLIFSAFICAGQTFLSTRLNTIWTLILIEFSVFMALGGLIRNEPFASLLKDHRQEINALAIIAALLNLLLISWIYFKKSNRPQAIMRSTLLIMSPLNLIFVIHLSTLILNPKYNQRVQSISAAEFSVNKNNKIKTKTIILLFDELSPDFLYGTKKANLIAYPALEDIVNNSNKYMNAYLPGGYTNKAIPNLFNEKIEGVSLKTIFEGKNKKTKVMGWALNYCQDIVPQSEGCSSISIFNARTLTNHFSIIDPIWTNFNLLPYQKPYGFIKIPLATKMHRETLKKITEWVSAQISDPKTEIIFAHLNIPHVPILNGGNMSYADNKRFDVSEENYIKQFKFINDFLQEIIDDINKLPDEEKNIKLIILSDHNIRALTKKNDHESIVLMDTELNNKINSKKIFQERVLPIEIIHNVINK
jgi:hypothetical protein